MGIKDLLLNKGWAGRTISRPETISRLNPIIRELTTLMHHYDSAAGQLGEDAAEQLAVQRKTLRADIGKLCETVFSCGGHAPLGVDMEPDDHAVSGDRHTIIDAVVSAEEAFLTRLGEERSVEHHIRTRAILQKLLENGEQRLRTLRNLPRG